MNLKTKKSGTCTTNFLFNFSFLSFFYLFSPSSIFFVYKIFFLLFYHFFFVSFVCVLHVLYYFFLFPLFLLSSSIFHFFLPIFQPNKKLKLNEFFLLSSSSIFFNFFLLHFFIFFYGFSNQIKILKLNEINSK